MSFFGNLLNIGKRLLGIGGAAAAPAAARALPAATRAVTRTGFGRGIGVGARQLGGAVALGGGFALGESIFSGDDGEAAGITGVGGNGQTFRRTIVLTIRASDGVIIRRKVLEGSPHLMNKDIQIAKRVFRTSTKLGGRLPKKVVRRSRKSMLMDQVMENALERASCPPVVHSLPAPRC